MRKIGALDKLCRVTLREPHQVKPTSYTGRRTTVLDKHHRGEASGTIYPDASKGKISELGQ